MVHNGIEYGMMASYAEGLNILRHANAGKEKASSDAETTPLRDPEHYQYDLNLADITEVWRRGSVIASWLLDLAAASLLDSPDLAKFRRPRLGFWRGSLDAQSRYRRVRSPRRRLVLPCSSVSVQGARTISPARCFPALRYESAAMRKKLRPRAKELYEFLAIGRSRALGITGDLAHKMVFPGLYALAKRGELKLPIIGVAGRKWTVENLHKRVRDSIERTGGIDNKAAFKQLISLFQYVRGDYETPDTFTAIKRALGTTQSPAHYLAIPPWPLPDGHQRARNSRTGRARPHYYREAIWARSRFCACVKSCR